MTIISLLLQDRRIKGYAYLESHQCLTLVVLIRRRSSCLPPDNRQLHVLDLQPNKQEVYPPHDHILEVVLGL